MLKLGRERVVGRGSTAGRIGYDMKKVANVEGGKTTKTRR